MVIGLVTLDTVGKDCPNRSLVLFTLHWIGKEKKHGLSEHLGFAIDLATNGPFFRHNLSSETESMSEGPSSDDCC